MIALRYSSSSTGSNHSLETSLPGTSSARWVEPRRLESAVVPGLTVYAVTRHSIYGSLYWHLQSAPIKACFFDMTHKARNKTRAMP